MKKGLGILLLISGAYMAIGGFLMRNGDQYKEEVFFNGYYGSDTINEVHTMIAVGIIMFVAGVILIFLAMRNAKNDKSVNRNNNRSLNTPDTYRNNIQDTNTSAAAGISPLLRRAELFLEDEDFDSADEYFNRVLDIDPECAKAYIGRLLVELKLKSEAELNSCGVDITKYGNYSKAVRFADNTYKDKLEQFNPEVLERKENDRKEAIYNDANELMNSADTMHDFSTAAGLFRSLNSYKDSTSLADICDERAKNLQIQYEKENAERLELERTANEQRSKRNKNIGVIFAASTVIILTVIMIKYMVIPNINYAQANHLFENKEYEEAIAAFSKLDNYKDSKDKIIECKYEMANILLADNQYDQAITSYAAISDYNDSEEKIQECHYYKALSLLKNKQYDEALAEFKLVEKYKDSAAREIECHYSKAVSLFDNKQYEDAAVEFEYALGYKDCNEKRIECHYNIALGLFDNKQYEEAADEFRLVEMYNNSLTGSYDYKDSQARLNECIGTFATYTNEDLGFSIDYPTSFDLDEGNLKEYNEIYFSNLNPDMYMQVSLGSISALDNIEASYEMKLNEVTNENTDVYYSNLQGNEFDIYWRDSETEYYYRGVFDDQRDIAYFIYLDYGSEDQTTCDTIAKQVINSFKLLE